MFKRLIHKVVNDMSFDPSQYLTYMGCKHVPPRAEAIRKEKADFAIVGAAYGGCECAVPGTIWGPREVRQISEFVDYYNPELDIDLREHMNFVDCGDVGGWRTAQGNTDKAHKEIEDAVAEITKAGAIPVTIGGDHSIMIPAFKGFWRETKGKIGIVHIDAHLDTADTFAGQKISNCTMFIRATELGRASPKNMTHIGIRYGAYNLREEVRNAEKLGMRIFYMGEVVERGIEEVTKEAIDIARSGTDLLYYTLDVDCLDAPFCPETEGPTPGGLTNRELLQATRFIGKAGVNGFDICEIRGPSHSGINITARIGAHVINELMFSTIMKRLGRK
jgi:agmatinase